jgi:putative membrane protein
MGFGAFAPGFSSSAIAIPLGIYPDLVRVASDPLRQIKQDFSFCLTFALCVAAGMAVYVLAFKYLFDAYERAAYFLFAGLIAGSLPMIFGNAKEGGFGKYGFVGGAVAFAVPIALAVLASGAGQTTMAVASSLPMMALIGFMAGVTSLIPGLTFSTILLITGIYGQLITALDSLLRGNLAYTLPLGLMSLCAVIGLVLTSKGIRYVLDNHPGFANTIVFGFMAGSLVCVLMQAMAPGDGFNWILDGAIFAVGFCISILFVAMKRAVDVAGGL